MSFIEITCANKQCGVTFCVSDGFNACRKEDHATFYCPNGHTNFYPQETEAERCKRLLQNERSRAEDLEKQLKRAKRKTLRK